MSGDRAQQATYLESTAPSLGRGVRSWVQTVPTGAAPVEQLHLPHGGVEVRWHRHRSPTVAMAAGYSDQSHLRRVCRGLAGLTLTAYLDRTHDHCAGHDHPQTGHRA